MAQRPVDPAARAGRPRRARAAGARRRRPPGRESAPMIHADVRRWLDRYVAAGSSYDAAAIGDLFSEDAEYRSQPWADPVVGREAIVADWLEDKDEPGSWSAHYDVWALDGDRASAIGESRYTNPDGSFKTLYYNN